MSPAFTILQSRRTARNLIVFASLALLSGAILALTTQVFAHSRLEDFTVTFYRAGNYLLRGENVYLNQYPHPTNGREYPPYAPIWVLYSVVPLDVLPLHVAEALRFLLDVLAIPFLAYLSIRWARLDRRWYAALLVLAPWHLTEIYTGQWTPLVFLGVLLCYWAARRANPFMMATGLWLVLAKPNVVSLIVVAALIYAWRNQILLRTLAILVGFIVVSSFAQPGWIFDLIHLYLDRVAHPRLADSILLLPLYPWAQLVLLALGFVFLIAFVRQSGAREPSLWLWAVLTCLSLVGAMHTFVYDWLLLMIPLAWLLRQRWGVALTVAVFLYPIVWGLITFGLQIAMPPPTIVPSAVLIALLLGRKLPQATETMRGLSTRAYSDSPRQI